jgi:hypothetical protein
MLFHTLVPQQGFQLEGLVMSCMDRLGDQVCGGQPAAQPIDELQLLVAVLQAFPDPQRCDYAAVLGQLRQDIEKQAGATAGGTWGGVSLWWYCKASLLQLELDLIKCSQPA